MSAQQEVTRVGDLIAFTILFHDHLLTFPAEVRHFWRQPHFNLGSVLVLAIRYSALCVHALGISQAFMSAGHDKIACISIQIAEQAGLVAVQVCATAVMTMRVYALYEKSRLILASLFILVAVVVGFSLWSLFHDPSVIEDAITIDCDFSVSPALSIDLAIVCAGQLAFDALIFILTVWKSYCIGKTGNYPLIDLLLRDGSIYFATMSVVNAGVIVIMLLASEPYKDVSGMISNSLGAILMSRLVLNLREPNLLSSADTLPMMTTAVELDDIPFSMDIDNSDLWSARRSRMVLRDERGGTGSQAWA